MASLRFSGGAAASQGYHSHHRSFLLSSRQLPSTCNPQSIPNMVKNTARLQVRQTLFTALASNPNPTGTGPNTNDAPQGPPLLAIVAGFLVFFLVSWIVGSTVMSLIAFILRN